MLSVVAVPPTGRQEARSSSGSSSRDASTSYGCSSRTSSRATARQSGRACPVSNTGSTGISITARRTPVSQRANGSGACKSVSPQDRRDGFLRCMGRPPDTSDHAGIACLPQHIGKRCGKDARLGRTLRASPLLHKSSDQGGHTLFCRIFTLTGNKLTKPTATRRRRYGLTACA
jgi:hypothetical protein